ncbi:hypothetical protein GRI75_09480 [Altererythrobacter soli]|uniref:Hsp70 family protein n=2 Tax=Croceibacterium soli TaxID=1739690 RepID=A0A6I4USY7_9SPHN|nr:hypothetical protein [Croceibacterium soli]
MKAAYQKHLEAEQAAQQSRDAAQRSIKPHADDSEKQKERFRLIREVVSTCSPTIEKRPDSVSGRTSSKISHAIALGAQAFAAAPDPDIDNGFIVGFDFGTSSLKLAVRQPYRAGENLAVMPVPAELRSGGHAFLWQTAVWYDPADESFSLFPRPGLELLEGFKTGIIGGNGGRRARLDLQVTRSEAAIAFVAMQMAHFFGWYGEERPLREAGGDWFLSINIGIPVAAHDDVQAFRTFRHIVAAARELVASADHLTLSQVRLAHQQAGDALPAGWEIIPELTAAIAGYAADPTSQSGSHVLIDVGASTLDIVAFNLLRGERIAVISAGVELLGSASLVAACENDVQEAVFRSACDRQFHGVFGDACRRSRGSNGFSPVLRSRDVQLITTGGGCASELHAEFIDQKNTPPILGSLPIVRPEPPPSCTSADCDRSRLLLAFGLTRDVPELLELRLPSQVPDIPIHRAPEHFFPSAEVT